MSGEAALAVQSQLSGGSILANTPGPVQVEQLTERLQQLKDAELARKVHAESLSKATQEAFDHHLARLLADKEDDACDVESVAESLQETVLADEEQHPTAVLSVAAALNAQQHPGLAGCGALLTSPAGAAGDLGVVSSCTILRLVGCRVASSFHCHERVAIRAAVRSSSSYACAPVI